MVANERIWRLDILLPVGIFILGTGISIAAGNWMRLSLDQAAETDFKQLATRLSSDIRLRFDRASEVISATRGMYAAYPETGGKQLREYFASLNHSAILFSGMRGMGFLEHASKRQQIADGAGPGTKHLTQPAAPNGGVAGKDDAYAVRYLQSTETTPDSIGLNFGLEAAHRPSIQRAVDNDEMAMSPVYDLIDRETYTPAVQMFIPVYAKGATQSSAEERRTALVGLLFSTISISELLDGIKTQTGNKLEYTIVDTSRDAQTENAFELVFSSRESDPGSQSMEHPRFDVTKALPMLGRAYILRVRSTPEMDGTISYSTPWLVLSGGTLFSMLLATLLWQQTSQRRLAEHLAGEMTADLDRLAQVVRHTEDAVSITDLDLRIVWINNAFEQLNGYSLEECLGKRHGELLSSGKADPVVLKLLESSAADRATCGVEILNRTRNGREYWCDLEFQPLLDSTGKVTGFMEIARDISARKEAAIALQSATHAAEEASRSKSRFLANMSHEIRTPMNAILGMLALLRKTELTKRQADYAEKSEGAAKSLLGLLNEILDFSKVEAGKMTLDPQPFRFDEMLRNLSVIFSANVEAKPVELIFDLDPALPRHLVGDALRLQQVLINLGGNAIKFTATGEVVLAVSVISQSSSEVALEISVSDSGIGIAPENHARIFSGFTQAETSTTRRFGGTGLGLALSQRIVALMGGDLKLESTLGKGSRFYFTINMSVSPEAESEQPAPSGSTDIRALVVDDYPGSCLVIKRMAQSLGWTVDTANSGIEALDLLKARATEGIFYQAVFVDWQMPLIDGWETSRRIRGLELEKAAPVIVMITAHHRESLSLRTDAEQNLIDGYLVKPVTASTLFDAVVDARGNHSLPHPSKKPLPQDTKRLDGMRLLLVEDNLNNQQVAWELLEAEGATVQIASNGLEGVNAVATAVPGFDVVLMDLQMPVMDGFAAASHIRTDLKMQDLPIVAMTANAMASDREACLAAGMNDHVSKPFDLDHLVQVLRKHLRQGDVSSEPLAATIKDTGAVAAIQPLPRGMVHAAEVAGIQLDQALRRMGGKRDVYLRMLGNFSKDLASVPNRLRDQLTAGDLTSISRQMHTLKGLAATLGIEALSVQAAECERQIAATPLDAAAVVNRAIEALGAAGSAIAPLIEMLNGNEPPIVASPTGIDNREFTQALQSISRQLENADMAATEAIVLLQQRFGAALNHRLRPLDEAIGALDFERALTLCNELIGGMPA